MRSFFLILSLLFALPLYAVEPSEVLDDPVMESRAREISKELRCLVCRNENIDESHADLAKDLRLLVRERLVEGDSNVQVINYIVERYGEYVLLNPTLSGANKLLWVAGPVMLFLALGIGFAFVRRRQAETVIDELSQEEAARIAEMLKD
ncbi:MULTISPECIES: cytochrome c-type biogenesis protein [Pacificibacter]|uniref:cytochrome c-type biogenesis protein n=1 Tax=Pacificibacter TaxID=1042323 RepID=UPI001C0A345A|nr:MULTISPECIES: cytochrome c-type biogenesis protein [Pacificibacter]MBU2935288.1 cytochrome c-type biogenesis protein CcmH [Pacificibacter marinus]MDO6615442.1 cytochrome c-type biogenesis protein CcmH [Pacificibacter sp. 1_MG-2023]